MRKKLLTVQITANKLNEVDWYLTSKNPEAFTLLGSETPLTSLNIDAVLILAHL